MLPLTPALALAHRPHDLHFNLSPCPSPSSPSPPSLLSSSSLLSRLVCSAAIHRSLSSHLPPFIFLTALTTS
eukprot:m.263207 g.263207  ORF g.263207 m.263207 type:complete len:72 (+) comp52107_c0_seq1:97-312(+)